MGRNWLVFGVLGMLVAATAAIPLSGIPGQLQAITTTDCHWVCVTYGVFSECAFDEVVVGSCGSQSWANCEDREHCPGMNNIYTAIKCCKLNIEVLENEMEES